MDSQFLNGKILGIIASLLGLLFNLFPMPMIINILCFTTLIGSGYFLSQFYEDPELHSRFMWGSILTLSAQIILLFVAFGLLFAMKLFSNPMMFPKIKHVPIKGILIGLAGYILWLIGAFYLKKGFYQLASYSGVKYFKWGGILYLISVLFPMIPLLPLIVLSKLLLIASWALILSGFVSMKIETKITPYV